MRWTEIAEAYGHTPGLALPTYRQMDTWTRRGLLKAEMRGDNHGRFRWWPLTEVRAALLVAALMAYGISDELAFKVAREPERADGSHRLTLTSGLGVTIEARSLPVEVGA